MANAKVQRRFKVRMRVRKKVTGSAEKPRLSVFRSNKQIYGQLINDQDQVTILAISSAVGEVSEKSESKVDQSFKTGKLLAEKALANGITDVVFDRGGYLYHGRVKSFADGAREGGLKF